jgi:acyl-CoA synthetase (AMP-forming)/AMP-acid ligase II
MCPAEPIAGTPIPRLQSVTYAQLYDLVADLVSALLSCGLQPGDRVASYSSNCIVSQATSTRYAVFVVIPIEWLSVNMR